MLAPLEPMPEPLEIAMAPIPLYPVCCPQPVCCPAPVCATPVACGPPPPLPPGCKVLRREVVPMPTVCAAPAAAPVCCAAPVAPLQVVAFPRNIVDARASCHHHHRRRRAC